MNGKTELKRLDQHRDRWSSYDTDSGLLSISEILSVAELKDIELFAAYDDKFLAKIAPDISIAVWKKGSVLFEEGSYIDLAFCVLSGEVEALLQKVGPQPPLSRPIFDLTRTAIVPRREPTQGSGTRVVPRPQRRSRSEIAFLATMDFDLPYGTAGRLGPGELFGEIGALSGWPQSVTVRATIECKLVQIRVPALRLMKRKSKALKERLDELYRRRALAVQLKNTPLFSECGPMVIEALNETVELVSYEPDETIVKEGELADALYLVRSGFVRLLQRFSEGELAVSYLSKGMTLGEVELLIDGMDRWRNTAVSVEFSELVKIPREVFQQMLKSEPEISELLWRTAAQRIKETGFSRRNISHAEFTQVAVDTGLVQGNSILVIDLSLCTRCDDCVRGCAETHGGRPRFVREGNKYKNLLIAKSCYHCRDPVCLVGCPTGAIHRAGIDEVIEVTDDICIGCSTCANNCPYDAIVMHETAEVWPDDMLPAGLRGKDQKLASKCDLCYDTGHGPACVSNCPQGCAFRVGSLEEFERLLQGE